MPHSGQAERRVGTDDAAGVGGAADTIAGTEGGRPGNARQNDVE